ncbi:MAG: UDP-N-acetylmuramoyl-L-alanyl-D-glutamate--2,6-diaminopimelate ligase [Oscillospiraceae bacterium]|nr:UDP-N-acetylmuramoyl-L-alanyl-D-glutamate--2,6-diaminopimelate ligase [Oscillospiraceae bacterium]
MDRVKDLSALLSDVTATDKGESFIYKGKNVKITGITDDTREVKPGNIFICVKGNSFDGHEAAADMIKAGAAVVVTSRDMGLKDRQIIVKDTRKFYGLLTAAWFDHPERKLILVGITGTNGKTTMATMIHHVLTHAGAMAGLIGTAQTLIGKEPVVRDENTPTTPRVFELYELFENMVKKGCRYCVMEVSSFALDQYRTGPAIFTCGVFTNLTQDHLDYHGTMENYYNAKKRLFEGYCKLAFINTDDPFGQRLFTEIKCSKFSYGITGNSNIYASFIRYADGVQKFYFCYPGKSIEMSLNMMGSYNVSNAVAAMGVLTQLKVPMQKIFDAAASFKGVRGRCELIPTYRNFFIVCDYAHSPDALENMLSSIKENTEGRLITLFGCGGNRDRTKRPLMAKAAAKYSDYLIVTSDNPRNEEPEAIIDDIEAGLEGVNIPHDRIADRRSAIFHGVKIARKGDVLVLAGKGHEDYQILKDNVHIHFDEREIVSDALKALEDSVPAIDRELFSGMGLEEIRTAVGGTFSAVHGVKTVVNAGAVSSDTRSLTPGSLFIAFKGDKFDGHDYVETAIQKGAVAAVTSRPVGACPCIVVKDTRDAILKIAAHYRNKFTPKLIGITGSVGKTTTKEMTALAVSSHYNTLKTDGNKNNEIGMSFSLLGLTPSHKAAIIEMGMNHFGEIERLSKAARPSVCVITNIGWSHAENLGSRENILKAKLEILAGAEDNAPLIICGDDDMLLPLKKTVTDRPVITCGMLNKQCDYTAEDIVQEGEILKFTVIKNGQPLGKVQIPCVGQHYVNDALIALAAAEAVHCDFAEAAAALAGYEPCGLRQHTEEVDGKTLIIDCYNAAPISMKAAIDVLCDTPVGAGGKRIAVLGDMLELGTRSPELHEEIGEYAAVKGVDIVIAFGQYAQFIAKKAEEMGIVCCKAKTKEEAVNYLNFKAASGDVLLFKASRGVHLEEVIKETFGI